MHYQFINDAESCIFATCALASEWDAKHCHKQTFQSCFKPIQWTNMFKGKLIKRKTENMFLCQNISNARPTSKIVRQSNMKQLVEIIQNI